MAANIQSSELAAVQRRATIHNPALGGARLTVDGVTVPRQVVSAA